MQQTNTNPYARKRGFFGATKDLLTNTVQGADAVVSDTIGVTTDLTGATRIISSVGRQAVGIWGENLLEDLEADRAIDRVHREIANIQQTSELEGLKAELAKQTAKRGPGRPAKQTVTQDA